MAAPQPLNDVILHADQITKIYPGTVALDHVDFKVHRGKVNALVGENGAGKSTLMKIIAGVEQATHGHLLLDGEPIEVKSPHDAARHGIGIIYQELNLFPNLNVAENIFVAREIKSRAGTVQHRVQEEIAQDLLDRLEQRISPRTLVGDLRVGQQQIIEIAKALAQEVRILIMDEPTSALSTAEVSVLFRIIDELKAQGVSIIYISHKLEEIMQIGDFITVLRDGQVADEAAIKDIELSWIIEKMVGQPAKAESNGRERALGDDLLTVEDMTLPRVGGGFRLDHVSFTLKAGEILGVYGLMGAGRTELFECLMGLHPEVEGTVLLQGKRVRGHDIAQRIDAGLMLIPEDRQRGGLVQTMSVARNMTLASLKRFTNRIYLRNKQEELSIDQMVRDLAIKVTTPQQPITSLSGGNQQKVVVAKALLTGPKVLLMDEPTRGIDVAAKGEIFEIMHQLALQGLGIIFVSTELKEVLTMADRILVMSKGKITGEFTRAEASEEALVEASAIGHGPADIGG